MTTTLLRTGFFAVAVANLVLSIGFILQMPWATTLWLWPDTPLSYLFVGSILAAFGIGSLLVAVCRDWRAGMGGTLAMLIGFGGIAGLVFWHVQGGEPLLGHAVAFAAFAAIATCAFIACVQFKAADNRPITPLIRMSFWVFTVALVLAGAALLLKFPRIFPWPLKPATSVVFGMIFTGLAVNYGYVAARGSWGDVKVSLTGFLVYDLVLIPPFVRHFAVVSDEHLTSLAVYVGVLVYSALLAIYALFIAGRSGARSPARL